MMLEPKLSGSNAVAASSAPSLEIVVINLRRAEERRRIITSQFETLRRPWRFFEAHTELVNPALRYDSKRILRSYGRELTPSQLALWSSHYTVITDFATSGSSDYLLVFEDDVLFDTAFPIDALTGVCRDTGIDYMRLFGMYYARAQQLNYFYDRAIIRYRSSPAGAQAYLLSKKGAARVAETCRDIETAWDLSLDEFWKTGLPIHAVYPFPALERFTPTTVPILEFGSLAPHDRLAWLAHRGRNKLRKLIANRRLARADKSLRARDPGFRQVDKDMLRHG
ncbi:MAG: glycosyltransferase family 25 protein [Roseovarius sp.]